MGKIVPYGGNINAELDENEKVTMRIGTLTNSYSALFLTEDEKVTNIVRTPGGAQEAWFLTEDGLYEKLDYVMDSSGQNHEGYLHSGYP